MALAFATCPRPSLEPRSWSSWVLCSFRTASALADVSNIMLNPCPKEPGWRPCTVSSYVVLNIAHQCWNPYAISTSRQKATRRTTSQLVPIHHRRPETMGGNKTCFWGTGSNTWHEKAFRTLNRTLFGKKRKMRPPATKGNKKRDKLGDKIGDKTSGRRAHHPTPRRTP